MHIVVYRWDVADLGVRSAEKGKEIKISLYCELSHIEIYLKRELAEKLVREISKRLKRKY